MSVILINCVRLLITIICKHYAINRFSQDAMATLISEVA